MKFSIIKHEKNNERARRRDKFHKYYIFNECDFNICIYCGELSQSLDHIPPLNIFKFCTLVELRERGILLLIVPACKECNSLLLDKEILSLQERKKYIRLKLVERNIDLLNMPKWTLEELQHLSIEMLDYIKNQVLIKDLIFSRIIYTIKFSK